MTDRSTAVRLARLGLPHARARAGAVLLASLGIAGALAGLGVWLAPHVAGVLGAWIAIVAVVAVAVWGTRRAQRATTPPALGRRAETEAGARAGSVVGLLAPAPAGGVSADLLALADARALQAVERAAPALRRALARGTRRGVLVALGAAAAGAALFVASAPAAGRAAAFWHPLRTLADARTPVRLSVDRATVRRGDSVTVTVQVPAAARATLWTRGPGEPWRAASLGLDSAGRAIRRIGPLEADLFLRASSGGGHSGEGRGTLAPSPLGARPGLPAPPPPHLARRGAPPGPRPGKVGDAVRDSLDVSGVGDRAIVQGDLDAARRGLLPGDTLRFRVEAWDNARAPHGGRSGEFALRLPSLDELRAAMRAATHGLVEAADSIAGSQRDLGERTSDLAEQRSREETPGGARRPPPGAQSGTLPFQATERAQAVAQEQEAVEQRVRELSKAVEEIARAAKAAGIDDTAFQARLREVQQLLQRAVTPELERRLRELQEALAKLDPEATRQALQRLAEAQQQLKAELERSQELFRRAAVEGTLASLAADAEDLRRRQAEWNADDAPRPDSGAAMRQRRLAGAADSLARAIGRLAKEVGAPPAGTGSLAAPERAARDAGGAMQRAAQSADLGRAPAAGPEGAETERQPARAPDQLRGQRDSLARAWRGETLAALDRALSETAALADRQQRVSEALHRGEAGAATRAQQASVEEGTDVVARQIRQAAGKHALVSPQLEAALGYAKRQMAAARGQLEDADPNAVEAASLADDAVDALNAAALALAKSRKQVSGAQSGSGFAEAVEMLARLARDQQGLNGQAQGVLPSMGAGQAVLEQLRALAARQRALAEQLERMQAQGSSSAAGPLGQEARELARQLEAGRLDQRTIQRQQRLYHRLLDAGRTLSNDEPDESKQRVSRAATGDSVHVPPVLKPGATGAGPRR